MSETSMQEHYDSPEQRLQKRRTRRWKRRARMVGPFFGVPILLATLALSVDMIEYQPQVPQEKLTDRPIPAAVAEKQRERAIQTRTSVSTASVIASSSLRPTTAPSRAAGDRQLDVTFGSEPPPPAVRRSPGSRSGSAPLPPMPPYSTRGR